MKIKVCGLKYPKNIEQVAALSPHYMGFIFYGPSPRFVGKQLDAEVLNNIPPSIQKTAVVVNEREETINALIDLYHFNAVQLHGDESPEFVRSLKGKATIIKAFGIDDDFDFGRLNPYVDSADLFLFDAKTKLHGGSGKTFDWAILNSYKLDVPFFLSGGISPDNLEEIKNISHPQFYGVDLNSRFETAPGLKDVSKLEQAFDSLKTTLYK